VLFEHYRFAEPYLDEVRLSQAQARTVIDTIDLNFERLLSKARATGKRSDLKGARREKWPSWLHIAVAMLLSRFPIKTRRPYFERTAT